MCPVSGAMPLGAGLAEGMSPSVCAASIATRLITSARPLELRAHCATTMPAGVKFWSGPVDRSLASATAGRQL
jgi:hypothetical protein